VNIPPLEEEGSYTYYLKTQRILGLLTCSNVPTTPKELVKDPYCCYFGHYLYKFMLMIMFTSCFMVGKAHKVGGVGGREVGIFKIRAVPCHHMPLF